MCGRGWTRPVGLEGKAWARLMESSCLSNLKAKAGLDRGQNRDQAEFLGMVIHG